MKEYVLFSKGYLSKEECGVLLDIEQASFNKTEWLAGNGSKITRFSDPEVAYIPSDIKLKELSYKQRMLELASKYIETVEDDPHLFILDNITQYGKYHLYKKGNYFNKHVDHIYSIFDGETRGIPVLTSIAGLSSEYAGGELVISFPLKGESIEYKLLEGDVVVFPSNFLFRHEVRPVTDGERRTITSWFW